MKYIHIAALLLLTYTTVSGQSGWVREKGGLFVQTSLTTFTSSDYYSVTGELFDSGNEFQSQALVLYGEYGITDRITGILNAPVYKSNRFFNTNRVGGAGDIRLGFKYAISKQLPISLGVEAEIPTGDGTNLATAKEENGLGFRDQINLPVSDGEFNVWTTLAVSQSLPSGNTYGSLYGQYNLRTQGFTDQYRLGVELGQKFIDRLWLIGRLGIQESVSDDVRTDVSFLYGEGTTYTTYGFTSMYNIDDQWMITTSFSDYAGFISERKNIYDGATWSLGVAFEIK